MQLYRKCQSTFTKPQQIQQFYQFSKSTLQNKQSLLPTTLLTFKLYSTFTTFQPITMSTATHKILTDETQYQSTLESSFNEAKENNQQLWVYITGAVNPETGKSWCPDCTATFPNLNRLKTTPGHYVLECPVERTKYRGIPQNCDSGDGCKIEKHPYKTNEKLGLTAIPTLFKIDMNSLDNDYTKLVEADCYNDEKFNAFTGI